MDQTSIAISAASAKAAEITKELQLKLASVSSILQNAQSQNLNLIQPDNASKAVRRAAYIPLLLDEQGREIDEKGNLVRQGGPVKTLAANVASGFAKKKIENPYLAHKSSAPATAVVEGATPVPIIPVDERLKVVSRINRGKRSLNFVEAGTYTKQADIKRHKEERKIIAGYSSGRRAPELADDIIESSTPGATTTATATDHQPSSDQPQLMSVENNTSDKDNGTVTAVIQVPPPADEGIVPIIEWWDEALLPKSIREERKRSRAAQERDDNSSRAIQHCKTYKYIQHPVAIKPLGGEKPDEPIPVFLTQKERKRIRRTAREAREREKRDMMMMGLIPAPEPKFKLSNFMKVLGDQAVSDPSKVEQRVVQQMRQRQLSHEMRNQARALTPVEWKEKKRKKLHEDTSRQVHVALFRVKDFSNLKHRFKVDVNAQQYNLTGTVLLCSAIATNLVVVEGGPRGIKRFTKLVLNRIPWDVKNSESDNHTNNNNYSNNNNNNMTEQSSESYLQDDDSDIEDQDTTSTSMIGGGDGSNNNYMDTNHYQSTGGATGNNILEEGQSSSSNTVNKCDLLWQGIIAKRIFHAFRFQECRNAASARKVLEAKGAAHYWDMAVRADLQEESQAILS